MPRLAANLSFLWPDRPFLERFAAAREAGFEAVEARTLEDHSTAVITELLNAHGLQMVLMNAPVADWALGQRGDAALAGREHQFRQSLLQALDWSEAMDVPCIHVMSGSSRPGEVCDRKTYVANLGWAAEQAWLAGRTLTIEPINSLDMPGYFLNDLALALEVVREVDRPSLRIQFDLYHQQVMRGDIWRSLSQALPFLAHVQVAGAPGRHEPDTGELDVGRFLQQLEALGYQGWVGCEYHPLADTDSGLSWAHPYLSRKSQ